MKALLLVPSSYEVKLLPDNLKYKKLGYNLYLCVINRMPIAYVGLTGIGEENISYFFDNISHKVIDSIDLMISLGTCGIVDLRKKISIGDIIISKNIIFNNNLYETDYKIIPSDMINNRNLHLINGKTVNYFMHNCTETHLEYSVDMEAYHVLKYCKNRRKYFLNIRIVSDYCDKLAHVNDLKINMNRIKLYKLFIYNLLSILNEYS